MFSSLGPSRSVLIASILLGVTGGISCVSSSPEPIFSGERPPKFVAADVSSVYVAVPSEHGTRISRFDKRQQRLRFLTEVPDTMTQFSVHDDYLYWLRKSQPNGSSEQPVIMRIHKLKPVAPEPAVRSRQPVTGFCFDATHMYWTQGGNPKDEDETQTPGVLRVMSIGSMPTNFVTRQPGTAYHPALSGAYVFWVTASPDGDFLVMTTRKAGHEKPRELFRIPSSDTEGRPPPLAADDYGVFVLTRKNVLHVAQDNGQVRKLYRPIHPRLGVLAADFSSLYFDADGKGLVRLPVAGGPPKILDPSPNAFVSVDDRFIYWTRGNEVVRLAK